MNNLKVKTVIRAIPIITIFILFLAGTYSRYSFAGNVNNNLEIASWNVKITGDKNDLTIEETQNVKFKVKNNPFVVQDKIAPGTTSEATIEVDLTGTEVAVDLTVEIDKTKLPSSNFKVTTKLDGQEIKNTKLIELENDSAFTSENGKKVISIELTWENDSEEQDTLMGIKGDGFTVPVTVLVEQHI